MHYSDLQGLPELRHAIAATLQRRNGIEISADEVIVTNGLTQACLAAFMAFLHVGDDCLLLAPYYPQHIGKAELAGANVTIAPVNATDGFAINRA